MKNYTTGLILVSLLICQSFSNSYSQATIKEEFSLTSKDGIILAGEIEYPNKQGKFPAAILVWGNGPHTRDQEVSGSPMFKQMAAFLVSHGMMVLRMDKRGFGRSTGSFTAESNYTTRDLANDIKLAYEFLNKHKQADTGKIGLIGHSEGAIIAYMLAAEEPGIDWIIGFGPPAITGDLIMEEQTRQNRIELGMSPETVDAVGKVWVKYFQFIKEGYKNDSVFYEIGKEFLIAHGMDKNDKRITHKFIDQLLDGYKTVWNEYFIQTDPSTFLEKIQIPFLAIFGGVDKQVTVEQNIVPMNNALAKAGNERYRLIVLGDEDHFFLRYQDKRIEKHKPGEMKISDRLLNSFTDWFRSEGILK